MTNEIKSKSNSKIGGVLYHWIPSIPSIIAIGGILGTLYTHYIIEKNKIISEDYVRKEQQYSKLIRSIRGFHDQSEHVELKEQFIEELEQCWLYCSDDVISKANIFLDGVSTESKLTQEQKLDSVQELMLSIRKDLINRKLLESTTLTKEAFKLRRALKKNQ